jgi:hypothetical protein
VEQKSPLFLLCDELLLAIFEHLDDPFDLLAMSLVSQRLGHVAADGLLWRAFCEAFRRTLPPLPPQNERESWPGYFFSLRDVMRQLTRSFVHPVGEPSDEWLFRGERRLFSCAAVSFPQSGLPRRSAFVVTDLPRIMIYAFGVTSGKCESIRLTRDTTFALEAPSPPATLYSSVLKLRTFKKTKECYLSVPVEDGGLLLAQLARVTTMMSRISLQKTTCLHCGLLYLPALNHSRACFCHPGEVVERTAKGQLSYSCCLQPAKLMWRATSSGCTLRGPHSPNPAGPSLSADESRFFIF